MEPPPDTGLPFFSYGPLKPGELGFHLIDNLIRGEPITARVEGQLREQDGLPILVEGDGSVDGYVMWFIDNETAYNRIGDYATDRTYGWGTRYPIVEDINGPVNVLDAASPRRGRTTRLKDGWSSKSEPLFTVALEVVGRVLGQTMDGENRPDGIKDFFRMQMAYLLLWSSIERYAAFKFGLGEDSKSNRQHLAETTCFQRGLETESNTRFGETIYSADLEKSHKLSPEEPTEAIEYYYQVRSNVVHRGKTSVAEIQLMQSSLEELYHIFVDWVLGAEFQAP